MASKRHLRRKQCQGKVRYVSQDEAKRMSMLVGGRHRSFLLPYHCEFCNGYHYGHPNSKVKRIVTAE